MLDHSLLALPLVPLGRAEMRSGKVISEKSKAPLRFAALRRVSTERQADKKRASLEVQTQQIERAVEAMGAEIVGWYGGQEHATEGFEKQEVDRLLADAQRGRFDAFVCDKNDRWSRDNTKSSEGIDIFIKHGVRFFVQTTEYDLHVPEHRLFVEMNVIFASFQARSQKQRSLASRIAKAKRGCCVNGCRPFGRTWDKETETWGIDRQKQAMIRSTAKRYLAGKSLIELAHEVGMYHGGLHKILTKRCGTTWVQTFRRENGEVVEVPTTIPPLLSEQTIAAVKQRLEAHKTSRQGESKNRYLLSRMVFCGRCGYTLTGRVNHWKRRYYRHPDDERVKQCDHPHKFIPADELEELVLLELFDTFGNPLGVQQAVERVSGDIERVREFLEGLNRIEDDLQKIEIGQREILDFIVKGSITRKQAETKLSDLRQREAKLMEDQGRLADFLSDGFTSEQVRDLSHRVATEFRKLSARANTARFLALHRPFSKMTYDEQRALVEMVFSGKTVDGRRMGVYITWEDNKSWKFDIHGHLIEESGTIRLDPLRRDTAKEEAEEGARNALPRQKQLLSRVTTLRCRLSQQRRHPSSSRPAPCPTRRRPGRSTDPLSA
jgi:site-specific DNA recombinase